MKLTNKFMKKIIFIACDTNNLKKAKKIISQTQRLNFNIGYKFGLEFFYSKDGRRFLSNLKNQIIFWELTHVHVHTTCS